MVPQFIRKSKPDKGRAELLKRMVPHRATENFFSARQIAESLGLSKRTLANRARRERWPRRRFKNQVLLRPPPALIGQVSRFRRQSKGEETGVVFFHVSAKQLEAVRRAVFKTLSRME